ncbi:hypothetical protein BN1088_1260011 [Sphingobacterium sp. PM2-P1-29]|nr:hypothetical protein BN1088_1260011 [Sphingobacterium sp. PM2-P1-29]
MMKIISQNTSHLDIQALKSHKIFNLLKTLGSHVKNTYSEIFLFIPLAIIIH